MKTSRNSACVKRKKILFVIDSLVGGGAERVLCRIASALDPDLYDVQIALTLSATIDVSPEQHVSVIELTEFIPKALGAPRGSMMRRVEQLTAIGLLLSLFRLDQIHLSRFNALTQDISNFRIMSAMLGRHILAWKPDCVVSFLPNSNLISLLAKTWYRLPTPIICSDRNYLQREIERLAWTEFRKRAIRRLYPKAYAHIAVTPGIAEDLRSSFGLPDQSIHVVTNGIDISDICGRVKRETEGRHEAVELIAVGRLNVQKGFDRLLEALGALKHLSWRLTILGTGEEQGPLEHIARRHGIQDKIDFVGWKENPGDWMARSDVFILSSRWEGMPNAMLEAMALGLPVIATDCPTGPRLLLDNGRAGLLVSNDSIPELSGAIASLIEDEDERLKLGHLARERSSEFSTSKMVSGFQAIIDKACESSY